MEVSGNLQLLLLYCQGKGPWCLLAGCQVSPGTSLDVVKKDRNLCNCQESNPGHLAQTSIAYSLSYITKKN